MNQIDIVKKFDSGEEAVSYALWVLANLARHGGKKLAKREGSAVGANSDDSFHKPLVVFDIDATLVTQSSSAIEPTIRLLKKLKAYGARVHLVTARHPSMREETIAELTSVAITPNLYESLYITPEDARTDMGAVGRWKEAARRKIGIQAGAPIALTVGDQWTDILAVKSLEELNELDAAFIGFGECPKYILVRPKDGISVLGLKLAYEER